MVPNAKTILEVVKVNQSFQVGDENIQVLKDVDFKIQENTFNILYGPSGSGKSTLLNILTGLQKPSVGHVTFNSRNVYDLSPNQLAHFRANDIGIMYQQNYWVKSLNVIENVCIPLFFLGYKRAHATKIAQDTLDKFNMGEYSKKTPYLLSGGEQQRIALARAVVNDPLVIVADEPTGNLDSKRGDMIMDLLQQYQTELKRTIILVTHNLEYLPLADQLIHIQDGQVEDMIAGDIQLTTAKLLGEMKERIDRLSKVKHNETTK